MKKRVFTYFALILVLSTVFMSPLSIVASEFTSDGQSIEVNEKLIKEEAKAAAEEEAKAAAEEEAKAAAEEEAKAAAEEEAKAAAEEEAKAAAEEEAKAAAEEEKRGTKQEINKVTKKDEQEITEDNELEAEETFILELKGNLNNNHNYKADDKVTFNLPESVVVAESVNKVTEVGSTNVANYTINDNGVVELAFLDEAESVSNGDMVLAVEVVL